MKIILFRFEKEKINFLECDINSGNLVIGKKETIFLESANSNGEKYNNILNELLHFPSIYSPELFAYQPAPPNLRGKIDEVRFANEAILNLFCYQQNINFLELTKPTVRKKLGIANKVFKELLEQTKREILQDYSIAKSDKLIRLTALYP